jgi:hypothetical protein
LLLLLYLYVIIVSHSVPLSSGLEGPLTFGGGLALAGLIVSRLLRSLDWRGGPAIPTGCLLHLAFVAVAGLTFFFVFTGNVSYRCPDQAQATSCVKLDNWKMSAGHYYRQFPYDSDWSHDPDTPWVEISRPEYVAEVGTRLRIAALFSVFVLCVAWALSGSLLQPSKDGKPTSNLKLMDPVLPPRRGL